MALTDKLTAIANSIRAKNGSSDTYTLAEMPSAIMAIEGSANVEPVTYSQVNPVVAEYLASASYSPSDYSVSQVETYANQDTSYRKDNPVGVTIPISEAGTLVVIDNASGVGVKKTVAVGNETVYNTIPSTEGVDYLVRDGDGNISSCGHVIPTGALRMIKVGTKPFNMRDLGGWTCDGGKVKYGKMIRGAELNGTGYAVVLTDADKAVFRDQLGIRAEIDLRSDAEVTNITGSAIGNSIAWEHYSVGSYADGVNVANTGLAFKPLIRSLIAHAVANEPCYIHCVGGADRTGTICAILEGLLGVSQSDIDKDYELTSFVNTLHSGETVTRKRSADYWTGFITYIGTMTGTTFRDKVVNWAQRIGITIDEINAFRAAMIDGTPETLTSGVETYAVSTTLVNALSDNESESIAQYQPYVANIHLKVPKGYAIGSVQVKMGGVDITDWAWTGNDTVLYRSVANTLTHCSTSNTKKTVIDGQSYFAEITPTEGYTLTGATISIKMGGTEVSTTYYKDGYIAIPSVTGNIEISITAVESALPYTNQLPVSTDASGAVYNGKGFKENTAFGETGAELDRTGKADSYVAATGFIPIPVTSNSNLGQVVVRVANAEILKADETRLCFYDTSKTFLGIVYGSNMVTDESTATNSTKVLVELDSGSHIVKLDPSVLANYYKTAQSKTAAFFRVAGAGIDDETIITVNEEI